ncbi:hypothetical protein QAD02_015014 [Eretmocerus hayati]|uniref:Uncharacterized protein n=1 Tax=Eretmocerus hayati TaxID=131215 RepID=A0ACC2P9V7_9HYME|nr:hypothetical protein QAD02_015014 [Eretmocerus hayati]
MCKRVRLKRAGDADGDLVKCINNGVSLQRLRELAESIVSLFREEIVTTYFKPFRYINKVRHHASGTLHEHLNYLQNKFRKKNLMTQNNVRTNVVEVLNVNPDMGKFFSFALFEILLENITDAKTFHFFQTAQAILPGLEALEEKLRLAGLTLQPMPVLIGPLAAIHESYVAVNNVLYRASLVLDAVNSCFKISFALDSDFPKRASLNWIFIQKDIFEIDLHEDITSRNVDALIGEVKNIIKIQFDQAAAA